MSAEEVKAVLAQALGHEPGYWAPGVARLGWAFSVQNDGARLIINRALGEAAKIRYMKNRSEVLDDR